jgi:hypothetical protein
MGDRRQGSPGFRLQTNCEERFGLKTAVDAFATYEFTELPIQPCLDLVPGPAARWKAIWPSLVGVGERFRLAILAEDVWGNPTQAQAKLSLVSSVPIDGLPAVVELRAGDGPLVLDNLRVHSADDLELQVMADREKLASANPLRVAKDASLKRYWGDLHGQSGETIGSGTAEAYFRYARDKAFIDLVGHQGNDFQITDAFWQKLNQLTAEFDEPGSFVCVPGYEWSGRWNGGDRNIFPAGHEGQTSTHRFTLHESCFVRSKEDAVVIARWWPYADTRPLTTDVLSACGMAPTWGMLEWPRTHLIRLLGRGICHSDDHKGCPGATWPGATFGAIGADLLSDARADARRSRGAAAQALPHHGTRLSISTAGSTSLLPSLRRTG